MLAQVAFLIVVTARPRPDENKIKRLDLIPYLPHSLFHVGHGDTGAVFLVPKIQKHAVTVAVLQWNPFRTGLAGNQMFQCVNVSPYMVT